ncbi:hypothetical protein D3C74_71610 [compost metagenome]
MPGRLVRSQTALRVAELLGSREGRRHLSSYGWTQGMPVVMTQPLEALDDVMGLVSVHKRPVLVAMVEPQSEELKFLHISEPSPVLEVVQASAPRSKIKDLFGQAEHSGMAAFRVKYWQYTAIAHVVPPFDASMLGHRYATQEYGSSV